MKIVLNGTFVVDQNITGTDNTDEDVLVTATLLTGILTTKTINNDGNWIFKW